MHFLSQFLHNATSITANSENQSQEGQLRLLSVRSGDRICVTHERQLLFGGVVSSVQFQKGLLPGSHTYFVPKSL